MALATKILGFWALVWVFVDVFIGGTLPQVKRLISAKIDLLPLISPLKGSRN
jgi:hypothetical protein